MFYISLNTLLLSGTEKKDRIIEYQLDIASILPLRLHSAKIITALEPLFESTWLSHSKMNNPTSPESMV